MPISPSVWQVEWVYISDTISSRQKNRELHLFPSTDVHRHFTVALVLHQKKMLVVFGFWSKLMDEIRTSKGGCEEILLSTNNKYENLFEVYAEVK